MNENEKIEEPQTLEKPNSEESEISEESENSESSDHPEEADADGDADSDKSEGSTLAAEQHSLKKLIAEAEQRGYLRGRNEKIEQLMSAPGLYERIDNPRDTSTYSDDNSFELLRHQRISIWDK